MKLILLLSLLCVSIAHAQTGKIEFVAKGRPAFITISGEAPLEQINLKAETTKISGTVSVAIKDLTTGIELRDEHLKDRYLEAAKFPTALFTLEELVTNASSFKGKLLLHGVEKDVTGQTRITTKDGKTKITAAFVINLKDYQIEIPSYQGITVAQDVDVSVDLTL